MILILSDDLIRQIANYLTLKEILYFISTNTLINYALDNNFFHKLAIRMYSKEFWINALERPSIISKPLNNFKGELLRIENFQNALDRLNRTRWTNKDFYNYWKTDTKRVKYLLEKSQLFEKIDNYY